jgi:hypothetical protein
MTLNSEAALSLDARLKALKSQIREVNPPKEAAHVDSATDSEGEYYDS